MDGKHRSSQPFINTSIKILLAIGQWVMTICDLKRVHALHMRIHGGIHLIIHLFEVKNSPNAIYITHTRIP